MANYPASLDTGVSLPNPTGTSTQANPDHAGLHSSENAAIIAVEGKVGTGASTPTANTILFGTGVGTSAWTQLTSAQLAASLSDETGTGSAVFANTPTLITPKMDTINENTPGNGVTVAGVNLKSGVITTPSSVTDTAIAAAALKTTKFTNPYNFRVFRTAAQNTINGSTPILFDTKTYDTGSNVDVVTNKGRFTAPVAGFYDFSATAQVVSTTNVQLSLYKNGTQLSAGVNGSGSGVNPGSIVTDKIQLAATDYVEVYITTPAIVAIFVGAISTYFSGSLRNAT